MTTALEIEKLLDDYRVWLKDKTRLREVNSKWVEITTPYLDRHNDALQIYARAENGGYVLTDDSYTIRDLEASGCSLSTEKRQDLLKMTLNGFGVRINREALEVQASPENFPARKPQFSFKLFSPSMTCFILRGRLLKVCFLKM